MSATMVGQGGRVQLEPSDMRLALNLAKMAKEGFSRASIKETKYSIKKPRRKVREEKKRGAEFPVHNKVSGAIQRHQAMLHHNQMSGSLPCKNGTAMNLQTCWRRNGIGAPPQARRRVRTLQPTPRPPGTPPAPPAPPQPVTHLELNILKSSICRVHKRVRIQPFRLRNISQMIRIPSMIQILIQLCWLMNVSTLSFAW